MINENVNIKKIDERIENVLNKTNGKMIKSDIIYNTNKRYKCLTKNVMFNYNTILFDKFIDLKKFINNIFKDINNFDKKQIPTLSNIKSYCSKKKIDDKQIYNKFENNIIISNIEKSNKKNKQNLYSIKNNKECLKEEVNDLVLGKGKDKYEMLKEFIIEYYRKNNIIN